MFTENYSIKLELEAGENGYTSFIEYTPNDKDTINVYVEGDSLHEVLETAYEEIIEELEAVEAQEEEMNEDDYIAFLEEELGRAQKEINTLREENKTFKAATLNTNKNYKYYYLKDGKFNTDEFFNDLNNYLKMFY